MATRLQRITTSSHRYIAELDGLRFIAIFSVLLFHVHYAATHVAGLTLADSRFSFLLWPVTNGHRGVELFFVISGFILGLPYAAQFLNRESPVQLGRFYLRRLTRLEPPYALALLLFYAAAVALHNDDSRQPGFLSGLLLRLGYAHDVIRNAHPTLDGVTWTLEIEVQFYLLAPLLAQIFRLATLPRRLLLVTAIGFAPLLAHQVPRSEMLILGFAQFFLTGFLLADLHSTKAGEGIIPARGFDGLGFGALGVIACGPDTAAFGQWLPWLLGVLAISALRGGWLTALLRQPVIAILGGMCYSLYLLHYPIFSILAGKILGDGITVPMAFLRLGLVGLPVAIGAGIAYFILIERPCMNPNWPQRAYEKVRRLFSSTRREK